ncbi:hypothetical protein ACFQL1_09320 [Halomicroarcula sp. GCM10025709]|uniref:hypothetical protein n=1 Tax=Haloarcula TaxID=2237 RepID=UPI0024C3E443|nr:hypothetical protein [Halomicroarcula sp. YJ-61-S]
MTMSLSRRTAGARSVTRCPRGKLAYSVADETYDLPNGTNWLVYGLGLVATGVFLTLNYTTWIGGVVVLVGLWFVLDGATTI